jgi:hypothetical protein
MSWTYQFTPIQERSQQTRRNEYLWVAAVVATGALLGAAFWFIW